MQALVMIPDGAGSSDRFDEVLRCRAAAVEKVSPSRADCPPGQALLCLGVGVRESFDRRPVGNEGPRRRPRVQSADSALRSMAKGLSGPACEIWDEITRTLAERDLLQ